MTRTTVVPEAPDAAFTGATILPGVPLPTWGRPAEPVLPDPPPAPPAPPAPPVPVGRGSSVTTSSVPRVVVAAWKVGANEAASGSNTWRAASMSVGVSLPETSSTIPSFHEVGEAPAAGTRAPLAVTTSSMVSARRVAVAVNVVPALNHGNEWAAYTPFQRGSVMAAGGTAPSSTPKGGTSAAVARPMR